MVTSDYFLNKMESWEAMEMVGMMDYADKNSWEQTRAQVYVATQSNSKRKLKPTEVMKFAWDDDKIEDGTLTKEITVDEKERLKKRAEMIRERYIKGND